LRHSVVMLTETEAVFASGTQFLKVKNESVFCHKLSLNELVLNTSYMSNTGTASLVAVTFITCSFLYKIYHFKYSWYSPLALQSCDLLKCWGIK